MTPYSNIDYPENDVIIKPSLINFYGEFFNINTIYPYKLNEPVKSLKIKDTKLNKIDNKHKTSNDSEFPQ
jgi:hypothetical protein